MQPLDADRLARDLHSVMRHVEDLLQATADTTNEKLAGTRARVEASLRNAKDSIKSSRGRVRARVRYAAQDADRYVHEHPWRAVGTALGIGLMIGLLASRPRN